ncbi:MAG: T9SS type A sorting domain-containing protein [bacterium]|nr:T9SS type A sorting domain-containing protein [bacterium]
MDSLLLKWGFFVDQGIYDHYESEDALDEMAGDVAYFLSEASSWLFDNGVDVIFEMRGPFLLGGGFNSAFNASQSMQISWQTGATSCITADMLYLFTSQGFISGGRAYPDSWCINEIDNGLFFDEIPNAMLNIPKNQRVLSADEVSFVHEIVHAIARANHIDENAFNQESDFDTPSCPEYDDLVLACGSGFLPAPMLCDQAAGSNSLDLSYLSSCTCRFIENLFSNNNNTCLIDNNQSFTYPCPECDVQISLERSQKPVFGCEGSNEISYTIEVCNQCGDGEYNIGIEQANFQSENIISTNIPTYIEGFRRKFDFDALNLVDGECYTIEFKTELLALSPPSTFNVVVEKVTTNVDGNGNTSTIVEEVGSLTSSTDAINPQDPNAITLNGLFSNSPIAGSAERFGGTLLVTDDFYMNLDGNQSFLFKQCDIIMSEGIKIVIEGEVIFENCNIVGCGSMWDAIQVGKRGKVFAFDNYISDAMNAFRFLDGAEASVYDNSFENNKIGIFVKSVGDETINLFNFYGNEFLGTDYLLPPLQNQKSEAGVRVRNTNLTVGVYNSSPNIFRGLYNGIFGINSDIRVNNCQFYDIKAPVTFDIKEEGGQAIYIRNSPSNNGSLFAVAYEDNPILIRDSDIGIDIRNGSCWIVNTEIANVKHGIRLTECTNRSLRVLRNNIRAEQIGIELSQNNPISSILLENNILLDNPSLINTQAAGILLNDNAFTGSDTYNKYRLSNNIIDITGNGTGILLGTGRYIDLKENVVRLEGNNANQTGIQLEGTENAWLRCNTVEGPANFGPNTIGIDGFGAAGTWLDCNQTNNTFRGFRFNGMGDAVQFRGNTMGDHFHGLLLNEDGIIGQQNYHNNYWCGSYMDSENGVEVGARHLGDEDVVGQSPFFIDPSLIDQGNCAVLPGWAASGDWFEPIAPDNQDTNYFCTTPYFDACSNNAPDSPTPQEEDEDILLRKLANGTFQASRYQSALKYTGQRHLYKRLEQQSTPLSNWKLSFLNQAGSTPVGEYNSIDQSIKEALTLPDTIAQSLAVQDSSLMEVMDELSGIDAALSAEPPTDTAELLLKRREILASLALQDSIAGNLRAAAQKEQQETLSLIEAANQNAPADSLYEANEQAFNTLAIKAAASIDSLSGSELSALFSLANQCPLSGGDAVFRARSLYHLVDPTYRFDNAALCQPNAALRAPKATEPLDYTLFPNPTSGLTVLQFNTPITDRASVTLYSLQGQPVLQQTAGEGAQHVLLETAALPGGTYFCKVMGANGVMGVKRLVKL